MLIPVSARAEGEDSGSGTDEVTFTYISANPAGFDNEGANNLFDGNTGTKWCFAFSNSAYVIFQASKPGIVRGYTITTGADSGRETGRNPKGWTLYGSNDEYSDNGQQTWTVIDQVSNDSKLKDKSSTPYSYTCSSYSKKEKYKYFKWEITQGGSTLQMSEFKLDLDTKFCITHKIVKVEAKAPTCTEVGNEEYWKCTECDHAFKDEQGTDEYTDQSYVIAAKGHQVEGATCKICGTSIFEYTVVNGEVGIYRFADGCFVSNLVIPDKIDGCPVVIIFGDAFKESNIQSVTIPASVRCISDRAFLNCSSLTSVNFAEKGNLEIYTKAFMGTALTSVTIPASVYFIGSDVFATESLQTATFKRVAMNGNISSYKLEMFNNCSNLTTINVPAGCEECYKSQFSSYTDKIKGQDITGMIFDGLKYTANEAHDGMVCQGFADDAQAGDQDASTTDLTIPAMVGGCPVTGIAANAFTGKTLGSVSIPLSVETIEKSAFGTISSITFARIPSAVVSIEGYADQFAQSVESIYVPAGCEDDYQKQLASHVSSINGQDIVSNGLRYKRNDAKDGLACNGLSSSESDSETLEVTIPAKVNDLFVTAISANAFKDNEKLNVVSFAEDTQVKVIDEGAFSGTGITSVVIPASVATIGANAFSACQNLASMRLLREAEGDALTGYSANMLGEEPTSQAKIYVLKSSKDSYLAQLPNCQSRILAFVISDGLLYLANEAGDGYTCAGYSEKETGEAITIPAQVDGQPVTAIAERAFYDNPFLVAFDFAENSNVKVIGKEAFAYSTYDVFLLPASVEVIEEGAFDHLNCNDFKISAGSHLTTISKDAFAYPCFGLLEIPASVTNIGENAFGGGVWLTNLTLLREPSAADDLAGYDPNMLGNDAKETLKVYVPKKNEGIYKTSLSGMSSHIYAFTTADGLLYNENDARNGWMCMGFSGDKKDDVVIPEEVDGLPVTAIGYNGRNKTASFEDISSVVVPASVELVSDCAFDDVSKLYLKRIPVADAGISGYGFYGNQYAAFTIYVPRGCEDAYKAQLPKLAVAITGEDIIANNLKFMLTLDKDGLFCLGSTDQKLTELTIPASVQGCPVTDILTDAFDRMDCLEKVRLMADNVYIGDNAFLGASKLKYILVNSDEAAAKYRQMSFQRHELVVSHVEEENQVSLTDETGFSSAHRFIYYQEGLLSYHRTFGESGQYATICLPFDVNLEEVSGTFEKVYVPTGNMIHRVEETSTEAGASSSKELFILMLDKKELNSQIPAATPFFVKLAEGKSEVTFKHRNSLIWDKDEADKWKDMKVYDWDGHTGLMEQNTSFQFSYGGNYEPKDASQEQNLWTFNTDGSFGPQTTGTLAPFRLFLRVNQDNGSTSEPGNADSPSIQAREYVITLGVSDGTATGISEIVSSEKPGSGSSHASSASLRGNIYDLSGRKVGTTADTDVKKLGKGIYVVNGKKVVVK